MDETAAQSINALCWALRHDMVHNNVGTDLSGVDGNVVRLGKSTGHGCKSDNNDRVLSQSRITGCCSCQEKGLICVSTENKWKCDTCDHHGLECVFPPPANICAPPPLNICRSCKLCQAKHQACNFNQSSGSCNMCIKYGLKCVFAVSTQGMRKNC